MYKIRNYADRISTEIGQEGIAQQLKNLEWLSVLPVVGDVLDILPLYNYFTILAIEKTAAEEYIVKAEAQGIKPYKP